MDLLKVSVNRRSESTYVVSPSGSIDSETYDILQENLDAILRSPVKALIFDMKNVNYMSSMGLKVILKSRETVERGGGTMVLINLQPQISKIFDIVKAIPTQNIFSSIDEMDRYLTNIQRKEIEKRRPA
ncbi:MAG TPA: STAS domain-containing protein [Candidatus Omnitrophota bacterium]|nr:STAS domain-containing protein [Candidatus Omnitrophota bacterium]